MKSLGTVDGKLTGCPSSPNCVCSDSDQAGHFIEPLRFQGDADAAWAAAQRAVLSLPRTRIVLRDSDYLHAESRSALLGFVDDLELRLDAAERLIAVRSASRLGWSDMGVNRRRVETLRQKLEADGFFP